MTNGRSDGIIQETFLSLLSGQPMTLRRMSDGSPICPVCGCVWPVDSEHAWVDAGKVSPEGVHYVQPTWNFCGSCDTQFGNDDTPAPGSTFAEAWAFVRKQWMDRMGNDEALVKRVHDTLGVD